MAKVALGWLGWTEEQTLHSDVNAIELAYIGHLERLKAIHGSSDPDDKTARSIRKRQMGSRVGTNSVGTPDNPAGPKVLTPETFDRMFSGTSRGRRVTVSSRR